MNCIDIPIKDIIISENRRELKDITALSESIAQRGLINPITITDSNRLVAGLHRLKACESLGWEKIPANILQLDEIEAEITEIDENMFRHELSALQRAELLLRRKELYEARYPQTKWGKYSRKKEEDPSGHDVRFAANSEIKDSDKNGHDVHSASENDTRPSFASNTAKEINLTERTIRRDVFIASNLAPEVKDLIYNTPLEKRTTDLLTLSKLPPEEQYIVAKMAVAKPEAKLSEILKSRAVESAESQVCDLASKPIIKEIDPITYIESIEPKSVHLLITEPPHDVKNLPEFVRSWVPLALSRLVDRGQAYIISSSKPEEMQAYFDILEMSRHFALTNVLSCHGFKLSDSLPRQRYKHSWQAIFYLRGLKADLFDCQIEEEQLDIQHVENKGKLAERLIRHSSSPFDQVMDPFAGNDETIMETVTRLRRLPVGCEVTEENPSDL